MMPADLYDLMKKAQEKNDASVVEQCYRRFMLSDSKYWAAFCLAELFSAGQGGAPRNHKDAKYYFDFCLNDSNASIEVKILANLALSLNVLTLGNYQCVIDLSRAYYDRAIHLLAAAEKEVKVSSQLRKAVQENFTFVRNSLIEASQGANLTQEQLDLAQGFIKMHPQVLRLDATEKVLAISCDPHDKQKMLVQIHVPPARGFNIQVPVAKIATFACLQAYLTLLAKQGIDVHVDYQENALEIRDTDKFLALFPEVTLECRAGGIFVITKAQLHANELKCQQLLNQQVSLAMKMR